MANISSYKYNGVIINITTVRLETKCKIGKVMKVFGFGAVGGKNNFKMGGGGVI